MEELKKLNGKKVSLKTLEEIEYSMHVLSMECLGTSGMYIGFNWYSIGLDDGTEIDVYCRY